MKASLLEIDAQEWEDALRSTRHDFYHLPSYVSLCARQEGGRPCALYVTDGERGMLLPLIVSAIEEGGYDARSPYGYPGPLLHGTDDPAFLADALIEGRGLMHEAGIVSAFVRLHPLLNPDPPRDIGTLVRHGDTVSVDLTQPPEALWSQMRLNHRRDITRSTGLGWTAWMDEEWRHLESFQRLYRATMERHSADGYYLFDAAYFDSLRVALGDRLHLCVVEREGEVAAAGLFVETAGLVEYHLSGTESSLMHTQPTKMMMHFVCRWAQERDATTLHLGGGVGARDDSLMHFKTGFSPLRHSYWTLRMVVAEKEYARLVRLHNPELDPDVRDGFFPLYRGLRRIGQ